ncbi:type II toxin-antitoxin system PemK/MazF family toxin [Candidatus Poribacteria bacterium]|nr:type II toxin-antitoxin system PemK/MazF family toxin [Candidatus Poribacteria bacterium]MYA57962.1 type II toxin-antitoxin system PemK/MazF family toxin [Candidatus Poribacteria bacterium]
MDCKFANFLRINFNPQIGIEIKKSRPTLVLSPFAFNHIQKVALVCPIPHTDREKDIIKENREHKNFNRTYRKYQQFHKRWFN